MLKNKTFLLMIPIGILVFILCLLLNYHPVVPIFADGGKAVTINGSSYELPAYFYFCEFHAMEDQGYVMATRSYRPNNYTLSADPSEDELDGLRAIAEDLLYSYEQEPCFEYGDECLPEMFIILGHGPNAFPTDTKTAIGKTISAVQSNPNVRALILPNSNDDATHYEISVGPLSDNSPVIDGYSGVYITDVNNPVSVSIIKSHLTAVDDVDGDITDRIVVKSDDYSANMHTLGLWPIVFEVSDTAGNTASLTINVSVIDRTAPTFVYNSANFTSNLSAPLSLNSILNNISATDNYDGDITNKIVINSDGFSSNSEIVGSYNVVLKVTDSSGNYTLLTLTIQVKDDIKPTISGSSTYSKSTKASLSSATIRSGLIATDNYDGDLSAKITEVSNNYTGKESKVGNYTITYQVSDAAGNKSNIFTVTITVIDDTKPIFYISEVILNIENYNTLTHNEIIQYLCRSKAIDTTKLYYCSFTHDEYTGHEKEAGSYKLVANIEYQDGSVQNLDLKINVLADNVNHGESPSNNLDVKEKVGFFTLVWNWICEASNAVASFFSRIWNWLLVNLFHIK